MVIDELLVALGFEYDPKAISKFKNDISQTTQTIKQLSQAAVASAAAVLGLTAATTKASDEQGKLADEIGINVSKIDALQFALQRSGGSAEGMANSLRQLSIRAGETSRGVGSGIEAFGLLGISVTNAKGQLKPVSDLMLQISQRFQGLSKAKQIELADKLGVRDSIRLLQQGPTAIRELTDEAEALGVTTGQDAKLSAEFQDSLTDLWRITKQISRVFSKEFAPVLTSISKSITEWWKANRKLIEQNLPTWIENATKALKIFSLALGAFLGIKIVAHIVGLISALRGLSVGLIAVNAAALLLPALILAGVSALVLLIDDISTFAEGGESVLGDLIERFPKFKKLIDDVTPAIKTMGSVLKSSFDSFVLILTSVSDLIYKIIDGWKQLIDLIPKINLENTLDVLKSLPGFFGDLTGLAPVEGGGIARDAAQVITNAKNTIVDKVEIVVQGGIDTADNIANAVYNIFQQTAEDLSTPVDQ